MSVTRYYKVSEGVFDKWDMDSFVDERKETYPTVRHTIPFDVEKAKNGAKVVTSDGNPVRILDYSFKAELYPIVAAIAIDDNEECIARYTLDGRHNISVETPADLRLQITTKEGWMPIIKGSDGKMLGGLIYPTRGLAEEECKDIELNIVDIIKVSWSDETI